MADTLTRLTHLATHFGKWSQSPPRGVVLSLLHGPLRLFGGTVSNMRTLLILTLSVLSGCAWYNAQWKNADSCATRICPQYAAANLMTLTGGEYDQESQMCACAMIDPVDHSTVLSLVPYHY